MPKYDRCFALGNGIHIYQELAHGETAVFVLIKDKCHKTKASSLRSQPSKGKEMEYVDPKCIAAGQDNGEALRSSAFGGDRQTSEFAGSFLATAYGRTNIFSTYSTSCLFSFCRPVFKSPWHQKQL